MVLNDFIKLLLGWGFIEERRQEEPEYNTHFVKASQDEYSGEERYQFDINKETGSVKYCMVNFTKSGMIWDAQRTDFDLNDICYDRIKEVHFNIHPTTVYRIEIHTAEGMVEIIRIIK